MLKKTLSVLALLGMLQAGAAMASETAGCGVGTNLFKGKRGAVENILAITTNAILSQTFSITSGTAGCNPEDTVFREMLQKTFVVVNYDVLTQEMAMGQGQHLMALSTLLGCDNQVRLQFAHMTQTRFERLSKDSETMLGQVKKEVLADPKLAASCSYVG